MNQKQLDEVETKKEASPEENNLSEEKLSEETLESEEVKEKIDDVNEILDDKKETKDKEEDEEKAKEESKTPKKTAPEEPEKKEAQEKDVWDEEEEPKPGRTWKIISGILVILLIAAIYTNGFHFTGSGVTGASITQIDAEDKVMDYVNNNLLRPPFTAEFKSSEEMDDLFKVTLEVGGQEINSYLTKDGRYFFPQGFDLEAAPLELEGPEAEAELVEVSIDDDAFLGNENAPVTIIEFSEYQCPFCGAVEGTNQGAMDMLKSRNPDWEPAIPKLKELAKEGKIKFVFRDFIVHESARKASEAAECAGEQGMYWEYHDMLFRNQDSLNVDDLKDYAKELGLDMGGFNSCLDKGEMAEEVIKDTEDGRSYGVTGTPAFFINGKMISGAQPYAVFKQAIEEALKTPEEIEETELEEQIEEVAEVVGEEIIPTEPEEELPAETEESGIKEITIAAKKWRFFAPDKPEELKLDLVANKGDEIKLIITSVDVEHSFELPEFQISEVIPAQSEIEIEFTADKVGEFTFTSKSNPVMTGTLTVE